MAWFVLLLASIAEVGWAVGLKYTDGFTKLWPSLWTAANMIVSLVLLAHAVQTLPLGTAYAVWTGLGAAGTVLLGILLFDESASVVRLLSLALILIGVAGLKLMTPD
ncbi:MAG TPA: quaternary ammonium compound efflux SMR transporter SugE [Terriglobales bacterium]|nr:quaternary ammonium compound efflux SMR transporter SugE [Terriglobales bacterium]